MYKKRQNDLINKKRWVSVFADIPESERNESLIEATNPGAIIVKPLSRFSFINSFQSERNKYCLLLETLPVHGKLLLAMLFMITTHILNSALQFYIRKNDIMNTIDLICVSGIFGFIPHIVVYLFGILIEGNISRKPNLMDCVGICCSGIIVYGLLPLTYFIILANMDSIIVLMSALLLMIFITLGAYAFKIVTFPRFENRGSIALFSGFLISFLLSSIFVFVRMNYNEVKAVSVRNRIIIVTVMAVLLLTLSSVRNYQQKRFLKYQRSMFYEKPISFIGMSGILASPILTVVCLTITYIRWNILRDQLWTSKFWLFLFFGPPVIGICINILLVLSFNMTCPIYMMCFFPFRIISDLIFRYVFLGEKPNILAIILSVISVSSSILGIVGKYQQLKEAYN